jgi:cobalt-zinc-cadmium efflux system outer membrane protein
MRYPALPLQPQPLPDPAALDGDEAQWRVRVLEAHPLLTSASQSLRKAELTAECARADRTPDPTVGVFTSSEASRTERVVDISLSIPLGGSVERWRLAEQSAAALREAARLTQRTYAAGEADAQALLLVRRQALETTTAAQAARGSPARPVPAADRCRAALVRHGSSDRTLIALSSTTETPS